MIWSSARAPGKSFAAGKSIDLTAKEFDLLELFIRHAGQVLTREMIYEHIWDYDFGGESNIIEVYVRYLRTKLEATWPAAPDSDGTRRGLYAA